MKYLSITLMSIFIFATLISGCSTTTTEKKISQPSEKISQLPEDNEKSIESADIGSPSTGSRFTHEDVRTMLNLHNRERLEVGVGKIAWSSEIAAYA